MCRKCLNSTLPLPPSPSTQPQQLNNRQTPLDLEHYIKNSKGVKFIHININSIRNKFDEVKNLLQNNLIALFSCCESKLDSDRDTTSMYDIPGYVVLRFDRSKDCGKLSGGGLLIYVHESFKFEVLEPNISFPELTEIAIIKIYRVFMQPIIVTVIYNNPATPKVQFLESFKELNLFLNLFEYEKIIMGDLNFNLLSHLTQFDPNNHKLFLLCREFGLSQLMKGPTFQGISLLDHFYVSKKENYPYFCHFPFAGADHDLCFVSRKVNQLKIPPIKREFRSVKNVDWDSFDSIVQSFTFNFDNTQQNLNSEFWRFNNFVMNEIDKVAPVKKRVVKGKNNPWFAADIREQCRIRDKLRCLAIKSKCKHDIKKYRIAKNNVCSAITKAKIMYFKDKFKDKVNSQTLWDTVNELTSFRIKPKVPVSCLLKDNVEVTDPEQINDIFAESFIVMPNVLTNPTTVLHKIHTSNNSVQPTITTNALEIEECIKSIKNKKSSDPLYVSLDIMKKCKVGFSIQLTLFFTQIFNLMKLPLAFKCSNILPLFKGKGSRKIPKNYRPIVILSGYVKIFEKFLFNRISERVKNKLIPQQHAYRSGKSCNTALHEFTNYVYHSIDKKNTKVGALFIDLSDAFSCIRHDLLARSRAYVPGLSVRPSVCPCPR
jgi:hypothetical protein